MARITGIVLLEVAMNVHPANELILDISLTDPEMCSETLALVLKYQLGASLARGMSCRGSARHGYISCKHKPERVMG